VGTLLEILNSGCGRAEVVESGRADEHPGGGVAVRRVGSSPGSGPSKGGS
jgi:hypothetical protein